MLPAYLCFAAIGIALALIDLDVKRLPNAIVLPSYPVLAVLLAFDTDPDALLRAAIGAVALFGFYFVVAMAAPGAMGFGDVKLAGVIGGMTAYLSWGTFLVGAFFGFLFGALAGVALMAAGRAERKTRSPVRPVHDPRWSDRGPRGRLPRRPLPEVDRPLVRGSRRFSAARSR